MNGLGRTRSLSSGSDDSGSRDYPYTHGDQLSPAHGDNCIRCHHKVYSTEKVEVGVVLHKNCFRCRDCGLTLTLHTFLLARVGLQDQKEVFCKAHAPKLINNAMDPNSIGIKNAVHSQQLSKRDSFNTQIRLNDVSGWQYDPKAREFEHAKALHKRNKQRRPPGYDMEPDEIEYEKGDLIRRLRQGELRNDRVKNVASTLTEILDRGRRVTQESNGSAEHRDQHKEPRSNKVKHLLRIPEPDVETQIWSSETTDPTWHEKAPESKATDDKPDYDQTFMCESAVMEEDFQYVKSNGESSPEARDFQDGFPYDGEENAPMSRRSLSEQHYPPETIYERLNVLRPDEHNREPTSVERAAETSEIIVQEETFEIKNVKPKGTNKQYENFQKLKHTATQATSTVSRQRRPPEYLKEKRFLEQNKLEIRQRQEHDAMIRDLELARENQIRRVEDEIRRQAEGAVAGLLGRANSGLTQADIEVEKRQIEQKFRRMKDEKMKHLMSNLSEKERLRIDDLIERQTQEMLQLIDVKVPVKVPSPKPPRKKKRGLYPGPHIFDDVDFNAVQVAQYEQGSFTELTYELTRCCKTPLERARAIFRWLTFKNLNQIMFSEGLTDDSPYYFLKGIKYGLESYHQLFKRLCSYVGLTVKIICGLSKSAGYRPGMPFGDNHFRNSWAVIHIDGSWRFVDCHWGARHVNNAKACSDPRAFCYELDEFYFLTDPDDMIYMHYPDEPEWQLLDQSVSLEHFINLPVVKSHFFYYGLKFTRSASSIIETDTGKAEVVLNNTFKGKLSFSTRLEIEGEELNGYCIHHRQGLQVIFSLTLPRKGIFFLTIFACDKDRGDTYNTVSSFRVVCTRVEVTPFCKFPKLPDGFGMTPVGEDLGISAEKLDEYYLVCNEDKMILNLKFKCPVRVSQKLAFCRQNGDITTHIDMKSHKDVEFDRLAFQRFKDHCFISYLLRFPERGIYIFSVFAGYSESKSQGLDCACRYLIQCNKKSGSSAMRPFPKTLQYWHKCRIHEPTIGQLKLNKNVKFKVEVAKAEAVAVIVGQQWFYLKKGEGRKTWEGVAHTGKDTKFTTAVYARYTDNDKDFFPLLEYKLVKDD